MGEAEEIENVVAALFYRPDCPHTLRIRQEDNASAQTADHATAHTEEIRGLRGALPQERLRSIPTFARSELKDLMGSMALSFVKKEFRILFVEDVPADVVMVSHELRRGGLVFRSKRVETRDRFLYELEHHPPELILSDHGLPSFDGFAALAIAKNKCPDVPFIFVTSSLGEQTTIDTFESGATDYVLKENLSRLVPAVRRALREAEQRLLYKRQEQLLRESEERLRLVVDGVKDYAIFMLDPQGRVASWNSAAEEMEGYTAEDILGKHFSTFFTPEDIERGVPHQSLQRAKREGQALNEGWRVRSDGSRFWARVTITAIRDERGRLRGFSKVAHDSTEQKNAEEEIRQLNAELEQRVQDRTAALSAANKELEAFSYSVSHDLRAPLRHISGYVEILKSEAGAQLGETNLGYLRTIEASARHLGHLIDALLAFSRMGRAEMRQERVGLATLVEEARRELHRDTQGRNIHWRIGPLPEVQGDPLMLRQAMVNLLSNAIKYTRTRDRAEIEIGAEITGGETILFIRDNGVGFDPKYASKLFGVFQRLHSPSEFEGTGIGLANVRRVIHRHGGQTWAEGEVEGGATFYFSLPHLSNGTS